jgi:murein lipoprotein
MNITKKYRLSMPVIAAVLVASAGMSGCATTQQITDLQTRVDAVAADAQAAKADAAEAKAMAQKAMDTANDAKATSEATDAKIDRMFKKAMYK